MNITPPEPARSPSPTRRPAMIPTPAPRHWRFGLGRLLLVMTVLCVLGAGLSYAARAAAGQHSMRLVLILFSLAAPALLLVVLSVVHAVFARPAKPPKP